MTWEVAWGALGGPVRPEGARWGWGRCSVQATRDLRHQLWQTMSPWSSLCSGTHRHAGTGLASATGNGTATAYILYDRVLRRNSLGNKTRMGVMVRCPQSFGHILYVLEKEYSINYYTITISSYPLIWLVEQRSKSSYISSNGTGTSYLRAYESSDCASFI